MTDMNTCETMKSLLSDFIDDLLEPADRERMEAHLSSCEDCRMELDELREMKDLLGGLQEVQIPAEFELRLKRALKETGEEIRKAGSDQTIKHKKNKYRAMSAVAALFAVGIITATMYNSPMGIGGLPGNDGMSQMPSSNQKMMGDTSTAGISGAAADINDMPLQSQAVYDDETADRIQVSPAEEAKHSTETPAQGRSKAQNDDMSNSQGASNDNSAAPQSAAYSMGGQPEDDANSASPNLLQDQPASREAVEGATGSGTSRGTPSADKATGTVEGQQNSVKAVADMLRNVDYQIKMQSYEKSGLYCFLVLINTDGYGNTVNKEILLKVSEDGQVTAPKDPEWFDTNVVVPLEKGDEPQQEQ